MQYLDRFATLLNEIVNLGYDDSQKLDEIIRKAKLYIRKSFSQVVAGEYLKDLAQISFYPFVSVLGDPEQDLRNLDAWERGRHTLANLIKVIIEEINLANSQSSTLADTSSTQSIEANKKVFVVHGHDDEMKQAVARTLTTLGLEPVILHEQVNKNRTIIEKFEAYANSASFAVVLLSPDDMAYPKSKPENPHPRARQNVILELGFFLGKLGRDRVFALLRETTDFERPSDYDGIIYTPYDGDSGGWRLNLAAELKAAGYDVDANRLFGR